MSDLLGHRSEWTDFSQAVKEIEEELGVGKVEADALLCQAVAEGKIGGQVMRPRAAPAPEIEPRPITRPAPTDRLSGTPAVSRSVDPDEAPALPPHPVPSPTPDIEKFRQRLVKAMEARPSHSEEQRPGAPELWVHLPDEKRWFKVNPVDLRSWLNEPAQRAVGKRPRIKSHLAQLYPDGVPDPAFCPRKDLRGALLKLDPALTPLDDATLQKAIEEYNARSGRFGSDRIVSD